MKIILSVLAISLFYVCSLSANESSPGDTVVQFFQATKEGNIEKMKSHSAGSFYNRRKVLWENNDAYPDFLREYFSDSSLQINNSNIDVSGRSAAVSVIVKFPDNKRDSFKYLMKKNGNDVWKIVRQIAPDN